MDTDPKSPDSKKDAPRRSKGNGSAINEIEVSIKNRKVFMVRLNNSVWKQKIKM